MVRDSIVENSYSVTQPCLVPPLLASSCPWTLRLFPFPRLGGPDRLLRLSERLICSLARFDLPRQVVRLSRFTPFGSLPPEGSRWLPATSRIPATSLMTIAALVAVVALIAPPFCLVESTDLDAMAHLAVARLHRKVRARR